MAGSPRCLVLLLLALCSAHQSSAGRDIRNDEDLMPGWMGTDYEAPTFVAATSQHRVHRLEVGGGAVCSTGVMALPGCRHAAVV